MPKSPYFWRGDIQPNDILQDNTRVSDFPEHSAWTVTGGRHDTKHNDTQHYDIQHSDIQHSDIQHSGIQHYDIQH